MRTPSVSDGLCTKVSSHSHAEPVADALGSQNTNDASFQENYESKSHRTSCPTRKRGRSLCHGLLRRYSRRAQSQSRPHHASRTHDGRFRTLHRLRPGRPGTRTQRRRDFQCPRPAFAGDFAVAKRRGVDGRRQLFSRRTVCIEYSSRAAKTNRTRAQDGLRFQAGNRRRNLRFRPGRKWQTVHS